MHNLTTIGAPDLAGWPLDISITNDGDTLTIAISGEVDAGSADILGRTLRLAQDSEATQIVVDLTEVTLMDMTSLGTLLRARSRDWPTGPPRLVFVPSKHDAVRQVLAVTGLSRSLD